MSIRRQQTVIALLLLAFALLLFSNRPIIVEQASKFSTGPQQVYQDQPLPPHNTKSRASGILPITDTTLPAGAPSSGFTLFDKLYLWNGTLYVVTSNPASFPEKKHMISYPGDQEPGVNLHPTDQQMQIIQPNVAKTLLGTQAIAIEGFSVILYDPPQFMAHYYHWWGEIILGVIRVYSGLELIAGEKKPLPLPARFLLPNVRDDAWRDRAGVDGPLMRAAFPSATMEQAGFWQDLITVNRTFVFERALIVSRAAAHRNPLASKWYKMISSTMNATVPTHFWEPLRQRVVRNTVGYLPTLNDAGTVVSRPRSTRPIVTYVSRQSTTRRLTEEAHKDLINALKKLEEEGICDVNIAVMEDMNRGEQIELVARSTIMVGVHGNGLTHQIWMPPSARSTVFEIFYPKTYIHDYELLTRNVGHRHYAVWNDSLVTYGPGEWFEGVEFGERDNFQGSWIPVHGPTIADMIRKRLMDPLL